MIQYEEWLLDFTGAVPGVEGNRVICGTESDRDAWIVANIATAGQVVVSKRACVVTLYETYGIPGVSPTPPTVPAQVVAPAPKAVTHARVGVPNVPAGFKP